MPPIQELHREGGRAPAERPRGDALLVPPDFPGRWLGGISMILSPVLLLAGVLLRIRFHFFFPQQLAAVADHPSLMFAAYSLFLAGIIGLWPAIATLAGLVALRSPRWGIWGGAMVLFGLFGRTFHAGIDHLAFQLVAIQGVPSAVETVGDSYGAAHLVKMLTPLILFGWIVLAVGAYRAGVLPLWRAVMLGTMAALMIGVLKGSSWVSVIATAGLCVALVPLGIRVLRSGPLPSAGRMVAGAILSAAALGALYLLGQAG